MKTKANFSY